MIVRESRCMGCGECIQCGRRGTYFNLLICDECEDEAEELYSDNGVEVCEDCLLREHYEGEGICNNCGTCDDRYDGLCKDCFINDQEVIKID